MAFPTQLRAMQVRQPSIFCRISVHAVVIWAALALFIMGIDGKASELIPGAPATLPSEDRDLLAAENNRLRDQLKTAQLLVDHQAREIAILSKKVLEGAIIHKEATPSTQPVTPEAGKAAMTVARVHSQQQLRTIGGALIMYANAHHELGPESLEQLRVASDIPSVTFQSPLLNCRYHYVKYSNNMKQNEVVAYEESDDPYRSILFADGSAETLKADKAAQVIRDGHR